MTDCEFKGVSEFEIGYQLDHPNIVRYIDKKVSDDGVPRLILEYVDGFTFQENRYFCIIKNVWHRQNKRGAPDWD
jgi:serine/threonine protein kinase